MRIVAGVAKGRRIAVPTQGTRPTSDRAREGLFNTLGHEVELRGAAVLDLFAGSGAVGLEALSRGAARAVFVESDRDAARLILRNITSLGLDGTTSVQRATVAGWLATTPESGFDIVFADPPYALSDQDVAAMLSQIIDRDVLRRGGVMVIERSSRDPAPRWPDGVTMIKDRRYGEGCLWYGRRE